MKIGLRKAYDSVYWGFLKDLLKSLQFPPIFIQWIMACVTTVSYSISLNGETTGRFQGGRSLKQGDPLSPLFFVLTMEYLFRALKVPSNSSTFKHHLGCKKHDLVHLIFADDLMLFCAAEVRPVKHLMDAFQTFSACTGLVINYNKSEIVIKGYNLQTEQEIVNITRVTKGSLPFRYLSVPITTSRPSKLECRSLVEKMMARI